MSRLDASGRRALARDLSRVAKTSVAGALHLLRDKPREATRRIGFTGPPGAGKSTLIGRLARVRAERHGPLAIIAIDPSSPRSSGALLGDRIRMDALLADTDVYIRSLPSGWSGDGLADNLADLFAVVESREFAEVLLETVGVGQVESGARVLIDTLVLTLGPNSGDQVQAMKAGIIETADIVVVNKADLPGAERMAQDIRSVVQRRAHTGGYVPPVLLSAANDPASIAALSDAIDRHASRPVSQAEAERTIHARALFHARTLLNRRVAELAAELSADDIKQTVPQLYALLAKRLLEDD